MASPFYSLLNVHLALWAIFDELDIDDGITSLSRTCRALHESLHPYLESRVRRRFQDTPSGLNAAIKLAQLAELERQAPHEIDSKHPCHAALCREPHNGSISVYMPPERSEYTYCCRLQYENLQRHLKVAPERKEKFDAICQILHPSTASGLDDVLKQFKPTAREDDLRKLRFLSDLCRLSQHSTKFLEAFRAHRIVTIENISPWVPVEGCHRDSFHGEHIQFTPQWVELPEVEDLIHRPYWVELVHYRDPARLVEDMRGLYQRWDQAFSWVQEAIGPNTRPLSHTEKSRIERAFFRLEMHSLLNAMLLHEPRPQHHLALRMFAGGMRDWEVEEMMTLFHMVTQRSDYPMRQPFDPEMFSSFMALPFVRDVSPHQKPRVYYDRIVLASLRKCRAAEGFFSTKDVTEGKYYQISNLQPEDIGCMLPEVDIHSFPNSDLGIKTHIEQESARTPNYAWSCYAASIDSDVSKAIQALCRSGNLLGYFEPLTAPVIERGDWRGANYRTFEWSLLDRDAVEGLQLDRTSNYKIMLESNCLEKSAWKIRDADVRGLVQNLWEIHQVEDDAIKAR